MFKIQHDPPQTLRNLQQDRYMLAIVRLLKESWTALFKRHYLRLTVLYTLKWSYSVLNRVEAQPPQTVQSEYCTHNHTDRPAQSLFSCIHHDWRSFLMPKQLCLHQSKVRTVLLPPVLQYMCVV